MKRILMMHVHSMTNSWDNNLEIRAPEIVGLKMYKSSQHLILNIRWFFIFGGWDRILEMSFFGLFDFKSHLHISIITSNCVQGQTSQPALRRLSEYLRPRRIFLQFPRILRLACPPPWTNRKIRFLIRALTVITLETVTVWHVDASCAAAASSRGHLEVNLKKLKNLKNLEKV